MALVSTGAVLACLAVGLGAYGAHGLEGALEGTDEVAKKLDWWATAVLYHLTHAVAIVLVGLVGAATGRTPRLAGAALAVGVLLFSGTLYAMTLGAPRWFGAITPLGGLALMVGWVALAISSARSRTRAPGPRPSR